MYKNTKAKGTHGELAAACEFGRLGYLVSWPLGENAPYDLIVESPTGELYRVQVRAREWDKDSLQISLCSISKNYRRTLDFNRIDVMAAFDGKDLYVIPRYVFRDLKRSVTLRRAAAKNKQKKGVHLAEDFKAILSLMP